MDALILSESINSDTTTAEGKQEKWSTEPARVPFQWRLFKTSKIKAFFLDYSSAFNMDGSTTWTTASMIATAELACRTKQRDTLMN